MSGHFIQFLLLLFAGWVNRKQVEVIDYLKEENRVLREQMHGRRLRFTDDQRRRLAARGKVLHRMTLRYTEIADSTVHREYFERSITSPDVTRWPTPMREQSKSIRRHSSATRFAG